MRIIAIKTIKDFWERKNFRDSEQSLKAWFYEVKEDDWISPNDLKKKYRNASIVGNDRVVFNIKGNKYRLITAVNYKFKIVFIRFIGTHKEYDKIDVKRDRRRMPNMAFDDGPKKYMKIKLIKNNKDYKESLKRVEEIWNAEKNTKKGDELEVLSVLIEKYEKEKFDILPPDPVEAIKFRMEQMRLDKKDLAKIIGANRASEVLRNKRGLTLKMIRNLNVSLKIPTDSLIG